ncbi:MAG: host attachment protein [Acetobacteraceae bacterium]
MESQALVARAKVWFVIADAGRARIVSPAAHPGGWKTVRALESMVLHEKESDLGRDRPGRSFESATAARHAIERREAAKARGARAFLAELADLVDAAAEEGEFARLVLVAPTPVLHNLAAALGPDAAGRVALSVAKDLAKVPDGELARHLGPAWLAASRQRTV